MKKIPSKKTLTKQYSTDEVKRYLGSLSEDFQHKVSAIAEQHVGLNKKIDDYAQAITMRLDSHTEMIGKLLLDVQDIKNEKIGRTEFSQLEKRVLRIENRLHGVKGK